MKILVFYPYIPWPLDRGTLHRTFHLLRELAKVHEVHLFALAENGEGLSHKAVFETFCKRVEFFPFQHPAWPKLFPDRLFHPLPTTITHWCIPGVTEKLDELLTLEKYEVVHLCDIVLAQYFMRGAGGKFLSGGEKQRPRLSVPLVIDRSRVDLFYQIMEHSWLNFSWREKLLRYEGYAKLWAFERAVARRASLQIVCGEDDRTFARNFISRRAPVEVLVNGVDPDYFRPRASNELRAAKPTILFCGAMDYNPNIDALRWYFSEIHASLLKRVSELEVLIVGKNPVAEVKRHSHLRQVTVTGEVADVRPYYRRAWLQLVPLRIGGGSRLKIVESLAMGTPIVSTTIGAQGLGLTHEKDILIADTAEDFAENAARLLKDDALREALRGGGLDAVHSRLSWRRLSLELIDLYDRYFSAEKKPATAESKTESCPGQRPLHNQPMSA